MKKRILKNSRRLVGRRTYTAAELVRELGVHRQTLRNWRKLGLAPICTELRPWLYLGRAVKEFLKNQYTCRKCRLKPGEFWCLRCHAPRFATPDSCRALPTGKRLANGSLAVMHLGECRQCGCRMRRAGSFPAQTDSEMPPSGNRGL